MTGPWHEGWGTPTGSDIMYRVSGDSDGRLPSYVTIGLLHINTRKTVSTWSSPDCKSWWIHWMSGQVSDHFWGFMQQDTRVEASQGAVVTETAADTGADVVRRWCDVTRQRMAARETLRQYDACIRELKVGRAGRERDNHRAICVR